MTDAMARADRLLRQQDMRRPDLRREADKGRRHVIVAGHRRQLGEATRFQPGNACPDHATAQPLIARAHLILRHDQQRIAALARQYGERIAGRGQPIRQHQHAGQWVQGLGRLGGGPHRVDRDATLAYPIDRTQQFRRQPGNDDDDLRCASGDQQPRLIFDQRHATERQRCGQHIGPIVRVVHGEEKAGEHLALLRGQLPPA